MRGNKGVYDFTLLTADFFIEIFRHPTHMAAGWNLNMWPKQARVFIAENGKVKLLPTSLVYEMVAKAMGSNFIPIQVEGNDAVYGFACSNRKTLSTQIFLMNKSESIARVRLMPKGGQFAVTGVERLVAPGTLMSETPQKGPATIQLQPMSFTRIVGLSNNHYD